MRLVHRLLAATFGAALVGAASAAAPLPFARQEGLNLNSFVQSGPVAAHILLRSGTQPRLIVAFPAGNSGVGLWFDPLDKAADWAMPAPARPVTLTDAQGRPLHGVTFEASIRAPRLLFKQAVLTNVRVLRDYQALGTAPTEILTPAATQGATVSWARNRLDGAPGYKLELRVVAGTVRDGGIDAAPDGQIKLVITALTGEKPLTPFTESALLNANANADPAAREALDFLSYREKFLAGSWRFNTYFGRDTLMSVRLLMPALQPAAIETGIRSVLDRLSPTGQVAHEEDIGEFAILDHRKADGTNSDAPTYNYNMIDSNFMLAPVARAWLLDDSRGKTRAAAFLAHKDADEAERPGDALMRNIRFLSAQAAPFAQSPDFHKLISLKPGFDAGQWRDSNDGLGGGRYPYDVNAVFVPAALEAATALYHSGLLAPYLQPADRQMLAGLAQIEAVWRKQAPSLFDVTVPAAEARATLASFAEAQGVPATAAVGAVGTAAVRFHAIALNADGSPVKVINSDEGLALLFAHPDAEQLGLITDVLNRPFPAGLKTGAGLLVADPVFAPAAVQARFSRNAYHGMVIWSWQQAMVAAGLARQLRRTDLTADVRHKLLVSQDCLWNEIEATRSVQSSELWSWSIDKGRYQITPFGARGADADESNAAQLWSTVYLALHRPQPNAAARCPAD